MASRTRAARYAKRRKNRMAKRDHDLTDEQWTDLQEAWNGCAHCGATGVPMQKDTVLALEGATRSTTSCPPPVATPANATTRSPGGCDARAHEKRFLVRQYEIRKELEGTPPTLPRLHTLMSESAHLITINPTSIDDALVVEAGAAPAEGSSSHPHRDGLRPRLQRTDPDAIAGVFEAKADRHLIR